MNQIQVLVRAGNTLEVKQGENTAETARLAGQAAAERALAVTARSGAETARDTAFGWARFYPTRSAGEAAVGLNGTFTSNETGPTRMYQVTAPGVRTDQGDNAAPLSKGLLMASTGAALMGYTESGGLAVPQTVLDMLRRGPIYPAAYGTLDPTGSLASAATNDATFTAAYSAAYTQKRPMVLPGGSFATLGLLWDKGVTVFGPGPRACRFVPAADNLTYLVKIIGYDPSVVGTRGEQTLIGGFRLHFNGKTGCTGLWTYLLVGHALRQIDIRGNDSDYTPDDSWPIENVGWRSEGDQYSSFDDITCERVAVPYEITPDSAGISGGGINNVYGKIMGAYCRYGMVAYSIGPYPFGILNFQQLILQASTHCTVYLDNVQSVTINGLPPEQCTRTFATRTYKGKVIKAGHIHATNGTTATFFGYDHVAAASPGMFVYADNKSVLQFEESKGAAIRMKADSTSYIGYRGLIGYGSFFENCVVEPTYVAAGALWGLTQEYPEVSFERGFESCSLSDPVNFAMVNASGVTGDVVSSDSRYILSRKISYASSGKNSNVVITDGAANINPAGVAVASAGIINAAADVDVFAQMGQGTATHTVSLRGGVPTRLLQFGYTGAADRLGLISLWPAGTATTDLSLALPTALVGPSLADLRAFCARHVVPIKGSNAPRILRSAAPTTGTWAKDDKVYNSAFTGASGSIEYWLCTVAGTPGTWVAIKPQPATQGDLTMPAGYTAYNTANKPQVNAVGKSATIEGLMNKTTPGTIGASTVMGTVPAGFLPRGYAVVFFVVKDAGGTYEILPGQIDSISGNITTNKATTLTVASVQISAVYTLA